MTPLLRRSKANQKIGSPWAPVIQWDVRACLRAVAWMDHPVE